MGSGNPKHKKKITQTKPMGVRQASAKCCVANCSVDGSHGLALSNVEEYSSKLNWTLDLKKKSKRVYLCKKHYKEYKKLKNKDEKYTKFKDFGSSKRPGKDKPHYMLE
ncbi:MAG: hypothetical protein ACTSVL_07940 [Promethearchaeota archaeon]